MGPSEYTSSTIARHRRGLALRLGIVSAAASLDPEPMLDRAA